MSNQLTVAPQDDNNDGFMITNTLEQALKVSEIIATSSFCPKQFIGKPGDVLVCMQMGKELGLKPMQALQNIAVINGRPSLWGDAMLAVCRQAKGYEYVAEDFDDKTMTAVCRAKRKNEPEVVRTFSKADAMTAKLWDKDGPWKNYPKRMIQMRARGFALRDTFSDALRGIISSEEAEDYSSENEKVDYSGAGEYSNDLQLIINSAQLQVLLDKMVLADSKEDGICKYAKVERLEELTYESWSNIIRMLDLKIEKAKQEQQTNAFKDLAANKAKPDFESNPDAEGWLDAETGDVLQAK